MLCILGVALLPPSSPSLPHSHTYDHQHTHHLSGGSIIPFPCGGRQYAMVTSQTSSVASCMLDAGWVLRRHTTQTNFTHLSSATCRKPRFHGGHHPTGEIPRACSCSVVNLLIGNHCPYPNPYPSIRI